jgi:hypothetical protein
MPPSLPWLPADCLEALCVRMESVTSGATPPQIRPNASPRPARDIQLPAVT